MGAADKPLDGAGLAVVNEIVNERLAGKQDALTGTAGQVVGFDADGKAVAGLVPPSKRMQFSTPAINDSTNLLPNTISPHIDVGFTPGVGTSKKITGYHFVDQDSKDAQIYIGEPRSNNNATTKKYVDDAVAGVLPSGGTTGQALVKASDTDGDVEWGDVGGSVEMVNVVFNTSDIGAIVTTDLETNKSIDKHTTVTFSVPKNSSIYIKTSLHGLSISGELYEIFNVGTYGYFILRACGPGTVTINSGGGGGGGA